MGLERLEISEPAVRNEIIEKIKEMEEIYAKRMRQEVNLRSVQL